MAALDHGALSQEVANLKEGHTELRREFRILDSKMDSGFALLSQKLDNKTTPQWQAIGILVSFLLAIGGAMYWPIREALAKQESTTEVMRRENEARIIKLWDTANTTARELSYLQGQLHPLPPR